MPNAKSIINILIAQSLKQNQFDVDNIYIHAVSV